MNHDTRELIIGAEWFALFLAFLWLARGTYRLARGIDGTVGWPIAGRYVLAATALSIAITALDVVRIRTEPAFLEPYWSSDDNSVSVIAIRGVSVFMVGWLAWRVAHGGLTRGRVSSVPVKSGEVVWMRREDDWRSEA